MVDVVSAI